MNITSLFRHPTKTMCRDSGLALILLGLVAYQISPQVWIVSVLIPVTVLVMVWPRVFQPFAVLWFAFSKILGSFMSRVILTILFFVVVTPIGFVRRLMGADPMKTKSWKNGDLSAFTERNHKAVGTDFEQLF